MMKLEQMAYPLLIGTLMKMSGKRKGRKKLFPPSALIIELDIFKGAQLGLYRREGTHYTAYQMVKATTDQSSSNPYFHILLINILELIPPITKYVSSIPDALITVDL